MPLAVMGNFYDATQLIHAAEQVRDAGYQKFDIFTPYPVHGLDAAMGIKRTKLTMVSLAGAIFGLVSGVGLMWWTAAQHYKLNIGGKPFFSVPFAVPIMFEITVLCCGIATFLAIWVFCGLPVWFSNYQHDAGFRAAVDDTFVVTLQSDDVLFTTESAIALLEKAGAKDVRLV